ncbi:MAG TPA: 2-oxo acid dehydrogenase subunit E2 [Acidimicrobiia bacterium]|nr:2-oxo acid dehydrogenase subunit E2 [Acidimicrobiia bacterium]
MPGEAIRVLPWRVRRPRLTREHVLEILAARNRRRGPPQDRDPEGGDEIVPFSPVRKRIAAHMVQSLATSAHAAIVTEVDFERVARARRAHAGLSYLPFVARAVVDAIAEFPNVNASVGDDELIVHRDVHLGIAVDLDFQGLIVPVVRDAGTKPLTTIAEEITDLGERARSRRLSPDDVVGGTFTITNPGPYGTAISVPVINQPQVAILVTDRVVMRPVVVEDDDGVSIAVHRVGRLTLSFDHRAYDGAYAAAFLSRVRQILETRAWETEL